MSARKAGNPWLLAGIAAIALVVVTVLLLIQPPASPGYLVIRAASLLGYQAMFLAILSSAYLRQMLRWFGRPFLKVHHLISLVGLALVTLHPIAVALEMATARYMLPQFQSLTTFLQYGGAPALYLFLLAALVAAYRKTLGSRWRLLHMLTYLAFTFATVHAFLIGDDFSSPVVRVVSWTILAMVIFVAVERRLQTRGRTARGAAKP